MAKIQHIAIMTENPAELADFYVNVFNMSITQPLTSSPESGSWVFLTDGYVHVALIAPPQLAPEKMGLNHFGFTMDASEEQAILDRLKSRGIEPKKALAERPYVEHRVHDIHGNAIDLTCTGLRAQPSDQK